MPRTSTNGKARREIRLSEPTNAWVARLTDSAGMPISRLIEAAIVALYCQSGNARLRCLSAAGRIAAGELTLDQAAEQLRPPAAKTTEAHDVR